MQLLVVDEIDFLPGDFRERHRGRRRRGWRWAVAAVFVALTAAGYYGDRVRHARQANECRRLAEQRRSVDALRAQLTAIEGRLAETAPLAELRGRLRLQLSSSRLLAVATSSLPREAKLTEVSATRTAAGAAVPADPAGEAGAAGPADRDLVDYAARAERDVTLTLRGLAFDDMAVAKYIENLNGSPLLADVRLSFTTIVEEEGVPLRSFGIEARVDPSGSPGLDGPQQIARPAGERETTR